MRRAWLSATAVSVLHIFVNAPERVWGADDPYQSKTLRLRSGPVTLEPTQAPAPIQLPLNPSPLAQPPPPSAPSNSAARWITAPPVSSNEAASGQSETFPRNSQNESGPRRLERRSIGSERAILNFERRVTAREQEALLRNGIEVGEYLGGTAYTARILQSEIGALVDASKGINTVQHVVALDERNASIKIDPSLTRVLQSGPGQTDSAAPSPPLPNIIVQVWPEVDFEQVKQQLGARGTIKQISPYTRKIEMSIENAEAVRGISTLKDVKYIAPAFAVKAQNTHVRRNAGVDVAVAEPHLLSGKNIRVGVWDAGHVAANHPSFTGRLSYDLEREGFTAPKTHRHATHVAGIIAGSGEYAVPVTASEGGAPVKEGQLPAFGKAQSPAPSRDPSPAGAPLASAETSSQAEPSYPGMAVNASIMSFEFNQATDKLIGLLTNKPAAIDVMNNSWNIDLTPLNCSQLASYGLLGGSEFDAVVSGQTNGQPIRRIPIVVAAGNNRNDGICGLSVAAGFPNYRTVAPPATAKNVITVGAIDADNNAMTEFSGWGPTSNGRIKPDIVAPGCRKLGDGTTGIVSMVPTDGVGRSCGTSMAAPAVTGAIALMIEKMGNLGLDKLSLFPSTYKALLIHGAADLGLPGPDFQFGYGRLNLGTTLKLMDEGAFRQFNIVAESDVQTQQIAIGSGLDELRVTLVWDDRPLGIFAHEELSNDLDLVLISPSGESHLPFLLNSVLGKESELAHAGVDNVNVVEQVVVRQPGAGVWNIAIRASKIGSPVDGQTYSLVMSAN